MGNAVPQLLASWLATGQRLIDRVRRDRLLERVAACGYTVPDELVANLYAAWGDPLSDARLAYISHALKEVGRAQGSILQCGGSLFSVLAGLVCEGAKQEDKRLWVFEHDRHWGSVVRNWTTAQQLTRTHVITAPAEQFDGYVWYMLDPSRVPSHFSLVMCDASAALPSSARGVLTRMADHLGDRCVILARSARRPRDLKFLADWAKAENAAFLLQEGNDPHLKIALPDQRSAAEHESARLNTAFGRA